MYILVLLLVFLTPGCGNGLKYRFYSGSYKTSWAKAQNYCRTHHTDLVTIRDATENEDYYGGSGWIGLYREDASSPWKWSRGDEIANFIIWEEDPLPPENCAFKYPGTKKWEVDECNAKHSFMCSDEKLFLVKENKTWEEALEHCRSLETVDPNEANTPYQNHRYDLATLITPEDHDLAREIAQESTTRAVWTGLRYLADQWMWVRGEPVTYQMSSNCPGSRSCGALEKDGNAPFNTRKCHQRKNFLCSRRP
ncbi:C-type mannose receptor 2 isoform X2 [Amphiprion ocellaris]|nr:C-type mannose receptor 2 isoform X2 [Amphiprion ocellaris]XP_054861054.1 C-type mannose receptor 2 isoform X2 [Amphiprion ocellaris]XP_054861055.1 C-type mannose receptor 2 isoform X2 [Amphiprion ocellaris]